MCAAHCARAIARLRRGARVCARGIQMLHRFVHALSLALTVALGATAQSIPVVFQPGFHQALRSSISTSTRSTYRMKIPIGRAGSRVRVAIKAGDGSLTVHAATIASAATHGALASAPVELRFGDVAGFTVPARTRVTSDPVVFPVALGQEIYVSIDVDGALAASTINAFPDSYRWSGSAAS